VSEGRGGYNMEQQMGFFQDDNIVDLVWVYNIPSLWL
jgi:hypothetical protein